jgi:hypothetical protein
LVTGDLTPQVALRESNQCLIAEIKYFPHAYAVLASCCYDIVILNSFSDIVETTRRVGHADPASSVGISSCRTRLMPPLLRAGTLPSHAPPDLYHPVPW